jgi:hypothetical protein
MKKTILPIILISALLFSAVAGTQLVDLATANPIPTQLPSITIRSDGSIDPSNATINQNGNIYTLTDNLSSQTLDIQCNNIIINGAGKTLQAGTFTADSGITIEANGVTVKNISINQYYDGVDVKGSSNTITRTTISPYDIGINAEGSFNIITENKIIGGGPGVELSGSHNNVEANIIDSSGGITVNSDYNSITGNSLSCVVDMDLYGDYNNITGNTITGGSDGILFEEPARLNNVVGNTIKDNFEGIGLDKQPNTFYLNNFINNTYDVNLHLFSDPASLYNMNVFDNGSVGNYWSNYLTKYPNATEIDHTGIGDTYYMIIGNITDRYPLMVPYNASPQPKQEPEPFPAILAVAVIVAAVVIVGIGLLVYFKKRKREVKS